MRTRIFQCGGRAALAVLVAGSISLATGCSGGADNINDTNPDFGANVTVIDPSMSTDAINASLQSLATASTGFDDIRMAVLFKPGTYGSAAGASDPTTATGYINSPVGFMETIQGLGSSPDDVVINGNLRVATGANPLVTLDTFWRSLGNMQINPIEADEAANTLRWTVSQASALHRVDINGSLDLTNGIGMGTIFSNDRVTGSILGAMNYVTDSVQTNGPTHFYFHDMEIGGSSGHGANWLFTGVSGAPDTAFDPGGITTLSTTPLSRDVPFLFLDGWSHYNVFVPNAHTDRSGVNFGTTAADGTTLPLSTFLIAKPSDDITAINAALASGKNLLLTPGVYTITAPIHITKANTVLLGMGMASVTPTNGTAAILVDDVPNVVISSIIVDANTQNSDVLVQVGTRTGDHSAGIAGSPTTLHDVYMRVGGRYAGLATTTLEVNQNNVLLDDVWLWRADHGNSGTTGWTVNPADHGLVVNGDNVTALGLSVEHYEKAQTIWAGNGGTLLFHECEAPFDVPSTAAWMNGNLTGYPCYEVTDNVTSHSATVVSSLAKFATTPVVVSSAIIAPDNPDVTFTHLTDAVIYGGGGWANIINAAGVPAEAGGTSFLTGLSATGQLVQYP